MRLITYLATRIGEIRHKLWSNLVVTRKQQGWIFCDNRPPSLFNQVCLAATINRDDYQGLMNLMLDAGAPGLNITFARNTSSRTDAIAEHANVNQEYAMLRCITDESVAASVCASIEENAESAGLVDLSVTTRSVARVPRYIPGVKDHRESAQGFAIAS